MILLMLVLVLLMILFFMLMLRFLCFMPSLISQLSLKPSRAEQSKAMDSECHHALTYPVARGVISFLFSLMS